MKMRFASITQLLGLCMLHLCSSGCGKADVPGRPALATVTGTVMFQEAPLEGATVVFIPQEHSHAAVGVTDTNGHFKLQTYDSGDGAAAGAYRVTVKKSFFDDHESEHHLIPVPYASPDNSGLTAEVELGEENQFQFELTE